MIIKSWTLPLTLRLLPFLVRFLQKFRETTCKRIIDISTPLLCSSLSNRFPLSHFCYFIQMVLPLITLNLNITCKKWFCSRFIDCAHLQWNHSILTTGPLGKSFKSLFLFRPCCCYCRAEPWGPSWTVQSPPALFRCLSHISGASITGRYQVAHMILSLLPLTSQKLG